MDSLYPGCRGLLAGCSSRQLAAGSLSDSLSSFCTEKNLVQILLQPRRAFLLPSVHPGGDSCMGCDPASDHTGPCTQGIQVLALQVPSQPQALMGISPSTPTVPHMYQGLSAPQGGVHLLWVRISLRQPQIQARPAALPAASHAGPGTGLEAVWTRA